MDETYGEKDRYLYRAEDKYGNTVDFLLTKRRMKGSAQKFLNKAIGNNGRPRVINIDKSGANSEAIRTVNRRIFSRIRSRTIVISSAEYRSAQDSKSSSQRSELSRESRLLASYERVR